MTVVSNKKERKKLVSESIDGTSLIETKLEPSLMNVRLL